MMALISGTATGMINASGENMMTRRLGLFSLFQAKILL